MDNESKILKAIMERFGSLTTLLSCMKDDADTVIENISSDSGVEYGEIEDYIHKILG